MTDFKLGTYAGGTAGMTAFSAMGTPLKEPGQTVYQPYQTSERMASGNSVGRGFPSVTMYFTALTRAQRDMLRTFCPGASGTVYVYIPGNDSNQTFITRRGIMHWPVGEKWKVSIVQDMTIQITHLVAP
jgi:hypothetical protein